MAGYSGTPLARKLGLKENMVVTTLAAPKGYQKLLAPLPPGVRFVELLKAGCEFVHLFVTQRKELIRLLAFSRKNMKPDAVIWVSWPKKSSNIASEVTEETIREAALPLGLVDIKVCAVDETWSGLKLVIRRELRK